MILPDKHLPEERCLLTVGAVILGQLRQPRSVSALWESVRKEPGVYTFQHFSLALSMLHAIDAVHMTGDLLSRGNP
jgi:hypothetical protein